jgi:hypothetical protein
MNLQINLLMKTERRYQGMVSMKVIVLGSVSVFAGIAALVFSLAGISQVTHNANLDRARREWERLEPQSAAVRNAGFAATANQETLEKLNAWAGVGGVPMHRVLQAVQRETPDLIQFSNLSAGMRTEIDGQTFYALQINGRAMGELVAVDAKRKLNATPEVRDFCGEVRLVSSQRELGEKWVFLFEGRRLIKEVR